MEEQLTPEQIQVNDLTAKIAILNQIKADFIAAKGEDIAAISVRFKNRTITLISYLDDTSQYTPLVESAVPALCNLIDAEIAQHQITITNLNNIINGN